MTQPPNPAGCRWCGIARRPHARQWTAEAGWHQWEQPTAEQTKSRMRTRRDFAESDAEEASS